MTKVGYLRISSEEQADGLSPEVQRQGLLDAGAERIYEDLGVSGFKQVVRPGFEALLKALDADQVDLVIVNTYSRLSRNAKDSARLDDALLAVGAKVHDLNTGQIHEPAELTPELLALMARQESRQKSKRQRQTFEQMRSTGQSVSSKAPWGLRLPTRASIRRGDDPADAKERVVIRDPSTFDSARAVVDHYLKEGCSGAELLRFALREHGAPFKTVMGITKWLTSDLVIEHVLFAGELDQIQKIKKRHQNGWKRAEGKSENHPLRGLVICDECGRLMSSCNERKGMKCTDITCSNSKMTRLELIKWAACGALSSASKTAKSKLLDTVEKRTPSPAEQKLEKEIAGIKKLLNDVPSLSDTLQPQVDELEKRLKQEQQVDLSHWRLLSADWMDALEVWDWYQIPADLKPRVFRATINSIRCRDGRVVGVELKGGDDGVLPDKWPKVSNAGVAWGIQLDDDGKTKPAKLLEGKSPLSEHPEWEPLNWRGLLEFDSAAA